MKKQGNLFFAPKNGFFGTKKVEITPIHRGISTSVVQRYKICKRNANPLTLVNTNIISHFSSFFACKMVPHLAGISNIEYYSLRLCMRIDAVTVRVTVNTRRCTHAPALLYLSDGFIRAKQCISLRYGSGDSP